MPHSGQEGRLGVRPRIPSSQEARRDALKTPGEPPAREGRSTIRWWSVKPSCAGISGAYAPARIAEVSAAVRDRDAPPLPESAHCLSGLLSAFSTAAATAATDLEPVAARG